MTYFSKNTLTNFANVLNGEDINENQLDDIANMIQAFEPVGDEINADGVVIGYTSVTFDAVSAFLNDVQLHLNFNKPTEVVSDEVSNGLSEAIVGAINATGTTINNIASYVSNLVTRWNNDPEKMPNRIIVMVGDNLDEVILSAGLKLQQKNNGAKLLIYRQGHFYETDATGQVQFFATHNMSGNVQVEFLGHGSADHLGELNAEELAQATTRLQTLTGEGAIIKRVNLVGCNTGVNELDTVGISYELQELLPHVDVKGYNSQIKIDASGHKVSVQPGDVNALPNSNRKIEEQFVSRENAIADDIKKIKSDKSLAAAWIDFNNALVDNQKLFSKISSIGKKYFTVGDQLQQDVSQKKITQDEYFGKIQQYYSQLSKEVNDAIKNSWGDFKNTKGIISAFNSSTILTDYVAYLSKITASGTTGRFISTLANVQAGLDAPSGATASIASTKVDQAKSAAKPKTEKLSDASKRALALIWQTNEGSISLKNNKPVNGSKVISEILRVGGNDFFKGQEDVLGAIKYLTDGKNPSELQSTYDRYLNGKLRDDKLLYRGVSEKEYSKLLSLVDSKGVYTPGGYLSSSTDKEVAASLGRVVRISGDASFIPNYLYRSGGGDESEYVFPRDSNFIVTKGKDGYLSLTEVSYATSQLKTVDKQEVINHSQLIQNVAPDLSEVVSRHHNEGVTRRFAPQSFLLREDDPRGICDSLSEAWLFTLSRDDGGSLHNTFLDDVFLRSQALISQAADQGRLPDELPAQAEAFLTTLNQLHSSTNRAVSSLSEIVRSLTGATSDKFLSLHTGNHALAISRRTLNGSTRYYFYDPNLGEVSLPAVNAEQDASALSSLLKDIFAIKTGPESSARTLADYYQTVSRNGEFMFSVATDMLSGANQPDYTALENLLLSSGQHNGTTLTTLPAGLEALRQAAPDTLASLLSADYSRAVTLQGQEGASRLLADMDRVVQGLAGDKAEITGITTLPTTGDTLSHTSIELTFKGGDGALHTTTMDVSLDNYLPGAGDEHSYAAGTELYSKSQNLYSLLTGLTGLLGAASRGDIQGEAVSGTFLTLSVADITGVMDKLADSFSQALGISTVEFGSGMSGLLGKGASELAALTGIGEAVAGAVGKITAAAPLLNSALLGFTLYSDVEALKATSGDDHTRAIGTLTTDAVTGGFALGAGIASAAGAIGSDVAGGFGGFAAAVGILIDVMIKPDDPLGLRSLINPGSLQTEDYLKRISEVWTDKPADLYQIKNIPVGSAGTLRPALSFVLTARDLPDVQGLLEDADTRTLLPYLRQLTPDEMQAGSADPTVLKTRLEQLATNAATTAQLNDIGSGNFAQGEHDGASVNTTLDRIQAWIPLMEKAFRALDERHVDSHQRLAFILDPDASLPAPAANGNEVVTLDADGRGFEMTWTAPASYEGHVTYAQGPENMNPRHTDTGQVTDDIVMGIGQTQTLSADSALEGQQTLTAWQEGRSPDDNPYDTPVALDLDGTSTDRIHLTSLDHLFTVIGNARDNRFYSAWSDPSQEYDYTVSGESGDDTLFMGAHGNYSFDGGADNHGNGGQGDSVVAAATDEQGYALYDLDAGTKVTYDTDLSWRQNLSARLTGVENIYGSRSDEVFHGSDGRNLIVTGGGDDRVWLSSGTDQYAVSGRVVFHGQADRGTEAARDTVVLTGVDLADLTVSNTGLSGGGVQVTADTTALTQLKFLTQDNHMVYRAGDQWVTVLSRPDLAQVSTLQIALYDNARILALPGVNAVTLPDSVAPATVILRDASTGTTCTLQYDLNGNPDTVLLSLNMAFSSLTADNIKKYVTLVTGMDRVEWRSSDGVAFHFMQQTGAGHAVHEVMVVDRVDPAVYAVPGMNILTLPGSGGPGQDGIVMDITGLEKNASEFMLDTGTCRGALTLTYRSNGLLTAAPQIIYPAETDNNGVTLQLPDGEMIGLRTTSGLTLFTRDDAGNTLETQYDAAANPSGALFTLVDKFTDGQTDMQRLYRYASRGFGEAGVSHLEMKTADGVTFHFARQTGVDSQVKQALVVDDIDAGVYKNAHGGLTPMFGDLSTMPGVDVLMADITGLVQGCQATRHEKLFIDLYGNGQRILTYRSDTPVTTDSLSALTPVLSSDGEEWGVALPDGNMFYVDAPAGLTKVGLNIITAGGSNWQLRYGTDTHGNVTLTQAIDTSGHSHLALVDGKMMAVYGGNIGQKTGVNIDLTQAVQHGGDAEGDHLNGVMQVSGSAGADHLTGNGADNVLYGGAGEDVLCGGGGTDLLAGGQAADTYILNRGDQVVISAQDNGTATDNLFFSGTVNHEDLSFGLQGDDLVVAGGDRVAILRNWAKGDTHYSLTLADSSLDEGQFGSLVNAGLQLPQSVQAAEKNMVKEAVSSEMKTVTLSSGSWKVTASDNDGHFIAGSPMVLNNHVAVSQSTEETFDAAAGYRLDVQLQGTSSGLAGFHAHLSVAGHRLAEAAEVSPGADNTGKVTVMAEGGSLAALADGGHYLTVELEEDGGHGGVIVTGLQLQKLTGAMAIFDAQGTGSVVPVSTDPVLSSLQPQVTVVV